MAGYCSNSPLRCPHAYSMEMLNQADNACPHCGMSLVPPSHSINSSRTEQRFLQIGLSITGFLLLMLVYIYYANFV